MFRAVSLAALSLLAVLAGACGGGAASGDADPASAVPADAPFYVEAVVRPEGELREDALDAARKVLVTDDPSGRISELLDDALQEDGEAELDYKTDIEPWLGQRIGVWFTDTTDDDGDATGSAIVAITDEEAALAAVGKGAKNSGERLTKRSYEGTDYQLTEDGSAIGVSGDFLIAGPEAEFKRTLATLENGKTLADSDRYRDGSDDLSDDRLGHFYVDLKRGLTAALKSEPEGEQQLEQLEQLVPLEKLGAVMGSFAANGDRLALDVSLDFEGLGSLGALGNLWTGVSSPLLEEMPADSWAAFATPKYGESLSASFDQIVGGFGGAAVRNELMQQYGIDIDEDVLSWIGDTALFVRGDSLATIDGGLVIEVTDEAKAATGFGKLVGLLQSAAGVDAEPVTIEGADAAFAVSEQGVPKPVVLARGNGRVVIAFGNDAAAEGLDASEKLGDAELYAQAKDALEDDLEPGFLLSVPAMAALVEGLGEDDPGWDAARPYIDAYDVIAMGGEGNGGRARVRVVAGLK